MASSTPLPSTVRRSWGPGLWRRSARSQARLTATWVSRLTPPGRLLKPVGRAGVTIELGCAFEKAPSHRFNLCIGNPPYVRHHDIAAAWRARAERVLARLVPAYVGDGRANAYVYFIWLAVSLTVEDGLVVFLLPHDWMTRPASRSLRNYVASQGWTVDIYLLRDATFGRVLTTSSICVINKGETTGRWSYFEIGPGLAARPVRQPTRSRWRVLPYERASAGARAQRGLEPGNPEGASPDGRSTHSLWSGGRPGCRRRRQQLQAPLQQSARSVRAPLFREQFVNRGRRCWLISRPVNQVPLCPAIWRRCLLPRG